VGGRHDVLRVGDRRPIQVVLVAVVIDHAAVDVAAVSAQDGVGRIPDADVLGIHVGVVVGHAAVDVALAGAALHPHHVGGVVADRDVLPGRHDVLGVQDAAVDVRAVPG